MANTVSILNYTNTFGDWVNRTNALANEVTDIGKNNFHKDTGTLYLDSPTTGLQVANNVIIGGQLQVQGIGSSAYVQKNITVDGLSYFNNTVSILASSTLSGLLVTQSGTGVAFKVSDAAGTDDSPFIIDASGNVGIGTAITDVYKVNTVGNSYLLGNTNVSGTSFGNVLQSNTSVNTATLSVTGNSFANVIQANTSVNTATLSVTGTSFTNVLQSNTSVNTATLSVTGNSFTNILQANTSVNTATLSVTGTGFTNKLQANTNVNTAILSVTGNSFTDILQANTSVNTATLSVTGTGFTNKLQANTSVNTATTNTITLSVVGTSFTNVLQANTSVNTATTNTITLSVVGTSFTNVLQANTSVNTATTNTITLSVVGTSFTNVLQANTSVNTATLSVTGNSFTKVLQANTSVNTATLSVTGTSFTDILQANTSVNTAITNTATLSVTGTSFTNVLQANTSVNTAITNTATLSVTGTSFTNVLQANTSVNTATLSVTGTSFTNVLQANTSVNTAITNTATLSVTGTSFTNVLQANTSVNTATLSVTGNSFTNVLQANTSVNTATLSVTGNSVTKVLQANTSVNTATLSVTGTGFVDILQANTSINTAFIQTTSLSTSGQLSVGGNFIINGATVYNSNSFVLNAGSGVGLTSYYNVNRGTSGANSSIRWNEINKYWDILDVNTGGTYSKILTANLISDSVVSTNQSTMASSLAANTLNESIKTANTSLKSYTDTTLYAKAGGLISGDVTISGSLVVNGPTVTVNSSTITTSDSLIRLANNNTVSDSLDIGFYGVANTGTSNTYHGLVRQAGGNFLLFKNLTTDPSGNTLPVGSATTANTATLRANITGGIVSSLAAPIAIADGGTNASTFTSSQLVYFNGSALTSLPVQTVTNVGLSTANTLTSITTDTYGRITGHTSTPIAILSSQVTGLASSATVNTANASNITSGTLPNARLVSVPNSALANSAVTVTAGTGLNTGGSVSLGSSVTLNANNASTTLAGVVQLTDSLISTSTTTAATPNSVKLLNDYSIAAYGRANTSSNTFTGTTGSATPTSGGITITSTNGVTVSGSANTLTINTPQDVRTSANATFMGLTLTGKGAVNATTLLTSYSTASALISPKTSSGYSLAIASGTSDLPQLQVSASGTAVGDLLLQPYGGNIGMGVSSAPGAKLHVSGNIRVDGTDAGETIFRSASISSNYRLTVAASDYSTLPSWTSSTVYQYGSTATGTTCGLPNASLGGLIFQNCPNQLIFNNGGNLVFGTQSTERMRIDAAGSISIGTAAISSKLNVTTSSNATYGLIVSTPVVGLVAGNSVNMAYFSNQRGASNDGLRIINYRESTGSGIGDWESESYAIERNIDNVSAQSSIKFGASTIRLNTVGAERFRVDATGNVAIGITTAVTEKLVVNGAVQAKSGATSSFNTTNHAGYTFVSDNDSGLFNSSDGVISLASNGADVLIVSTNSVGIGANPTAQLTVYGAGQTTGAMNTTITLGGTIYAKDSGNVVGNGGAIMFGASQGAFASIKGSIVSGSSNTTGHLLFSTRNLIADGTLTERMRLDVAGNLAIGTAPQSWYSSVKALQVNAASIWSNNITHAIGANICRLTLNYTPTYINTNYGSEILFNGAGAGGFQFNTYPSGTAATTATPTQVLTIDNSGNMGVGATSFYSTAQDRLTVRNNQNDITRLVIDNQNAGASARASIGLYAAGRSWEISTGSTANNSNTLDIIPQSGATPVLRIDGSGNVGIGNAPSSVYKLEVTGTALFSDVTTRRVASPTTGYMFYGNTGTKYIGFDGTNFVTSMPMNFSILGNAATASSVAYSGLTGTVTTWNQNTTGTSAGFPMGSVAEIGRYLDFHGTTSANDYDVRMYCGPTVAGNGTGTLTIAAGGGLVCTNNITAYSDIRLKENITVIPNAIDKVKALRGVTFTRNDLPDIDKLHTGVIAQEVLAVLPEAVKQGDDGIYSVAYGNMVGLLIEAIKELSKEIDILKGNK